MLVSFYCYDKKPDSQKLRDRYLSAHLSWVEDNLALIRVAGPLRENGQIVGSLYVLEAVDLDNAHKRLKTDPYYQADIWQTVEINEFNAYAGTWVGGKNWPGSK